MKNICTVCKRKFPSHLIDEMAISGKNGLQYISACPLCALKIRNKIMGLPEDLPFDGEIANEMWEEATEYINGFKKGGENYGTENNKL